MIINDLDDYYIVFDTKNRNTELDTLVTLHEIVHVCAHNAQSVAVKIKTNTLEG